MFDKDSNNIATGQENKIERLPSTEPQQLPKQREEAHVPSKFASGDDLFQLRDQIVDSKQELVDARVRYNSAATNDERVAANRRMNELETEIHALNERDAEFVYAVSSELMANAELDMNSKLAGKYRVQMEEARMSIPHLNMHGLWVGKYGEHGYELINITYSGDNTLIATKVTGDKDIPKGEVTFTVDLSPRISASVQPAHATHIEPIELNPQEERQWGKQYLPRHLGKGQDASDNFTNNASWMEGQMICVGSWFSFTWVPLGRQIFFGRPSNEVIMRMLKEAEEDESRQDEVADMRKIANNMMEETYWFKQGDARFDEVECFE